MESKIQLPLSLRDQRTGQGLSLDDVSRKTRIRKDYLEKLESGDFTFLPTPYIVSLLKEYAKAVGLNSDAVAEAYYASIMPKPTSWLPQSPSSPTEQIPQKNILETIFAFFFSSSFQRNVISKLPAIGVVVGGVLLFLGFRYFSSAPKAEVVIRQYAPTPITATAVASFSPATQPAAIALIASPVTNKSKEPASTATTGLDKPAKLKLVIRTGQDSSWVHVNADGKPNSVLLLPHQSQAFEADRAFKLTIGKAQAVRLTLNGKAVALPQTEGLVHDFILSENKSN